MAPDTPDPHKGMLFSLLSSPPFLLPNKPPPLHLPITSPSSPFTTVRSSRRMRSCSLASTDIKLQGSWIHGDVIPDDGFGGWLFGKPEIEDRNAALPKLIIVGVGTSMAVLLAALSFYSFSRKGVKLRHDASFHTLHELFFPSKLAKDPGIDSEPPTLQVNPHSEADVDGEADMASDATKQKEEEDLLGDNKRIVVPVAADLTQQEAIFVLKKLKIIDYDVNANELCTRREYARWLVKTNTLLERNPKFRICPSASIAGSAVVAFDDVSVIDPDFWCIQALGESGFVPSKFLAVSSSSTNSDGQGSLVFSPESSISRFDLLNWKALLEYSFNSDMEDKVLRKNIGLLDLNAIFTCASRQLLSDLMADDKSITRRVFGNIRRLQPHKPVTKAQAAVALTSGRMAEAIRMELLKTDAEELAKSSDMEEIRSELIHKGDIQRLWEEKLIKERDRGFEVERDFHVALHDLETEKMVRDEKFAFYMKEKVALDCQQQLLSKLREEVDGMSDRLTTERINIVSEQYSLEKTSVKVLARQEGMIEAKSILEAEKEALEILRCWVEDEARGIQERAKLLEQAVHRWKWNEGPTPATS